MPLGKAVSANLVGGHIAFYSGKNLLNGLFVPGVHVISPETVRTDSGQHLARQFHPIISWDRREDYVVVPLPGSKLTDSLTDKGVEGR